MKVLYHQDWCAPKAFDVLKQHADGTVDIGQEGGTPVVTGCKITETPAAGSATRIVAAVAEQPAPTVSPVAEAPLPVAEAPLPVVESPSPRRARRTLVENAV